MSEEKLNKKDYIMRRVRTREIVDEIGMKLFEISLLYFGLLVLYFLTSELYLRQSVDFKKAKVERIKLEQEIKLMDK